MQYNHRNRRRRQNKKVPVLHILLVAVFACLILAGLITFAALNAQQVTIALEGNSEIQLEYGQMYSEAGASLLVNGEKKDAQIAISGQIIPEKLGTYEITYRAKWLWRTVETVRTVKIVDTVAPTIVLKYTDNITLPGTAYQEEGYVAEDNYDGDITHLVERVEENGIVTYKVTDSSGNSVTVTRPITYGDFTKPVLTLLGEQKVTIKAGSAFTDPGFTASDNLDGDITANVVVTGRVDTYTPGTYTIQYKVTDSYNNTTEITRTVVVEKMVQPDVVNPGNKVVYLTFDDGPSQHTPRLLEILEKYNVKATFFVVGTAAVGYYDDIVAGGHTIALHTNTHNFSEVYASVDAYFADLNAIRAKVKQYTGVDSTIIRFPGGTSNTVSRKHCQGIMTALSQMVLDQGYQYFDWNVDSNDAGGAKTADEVFNNVISGIQKYNVSIVLQHDTHGFSVDAVERIIQWGLANGYTFLPLSPDSPPVRHNPNN